MANFVREGHAELEEFSFYSKDLLSRVGTIYMAPQTNNMYNADLFLFANHLRKLCVDDSRIKFTAHQQCTLVVLDVAEIRRLRQFDCRRKTLTSQKTMC